MAALQALLDAAALALSGRAAERDAILGPLSRSLEDLRGLVAPQDSPLGSNLLAALFDALDAEIARWEERSRDDPDARSVLRAFLGVREILWEISSRRPEPTESPEEEAPAAPKTRRSTKARHSRRSTGVRRVPVEG